MTVAMGVALSAGVNSNDWVTGAPLSALSVLAAIDAHKDALASALGVSGIQANQLYPAIFEVWNLWHVAGTAPAGKAFPSTTLMDGLRDRGIIPMINWQTIGSTGGSGGTSSTTLAAAASAGATNFKVASVSGMFAGGVLYFASPQETLVIASVGTAGSGGTGVTVTAPAASAHGNGSAVEVGRGDATALRINAGALDSYIDSWAAAANAWRDSASAQGVTVQCRDKSSRILVRLDWEMNGSWFPWRPGVLGTTNANWKTKWQRIHDRVRSTAGATHVEFIHCPFEDGGSATYPGNAYVQWAGTDAYNTAGDSASLQSRFSSILSTIRGYSSRPIIVAESGIRRLSGNDATRASWITNGMAWLDTQPDVGAFCYMDMDIVPEGAGSDWAVTGQVRAGAPALGSQAKLAWATQKLARPGTL